MISKYYHNGIKTLAVVLGVLFSAHFASAQSCGSIDLGNDFEVCSGSSATLTPTENLQLTGNLDGLLGYHGVVTNPSYAVGAPDGSGAYFCRGNSGTYTGAVWSVPCNLPTGTTLKIRVKVPSGTAYFKVYGAKDTYSVSSDYTLISSKYVTGTSYQDIVITTNGEYNILKIVDQGSSPFKIDAITFEKTCTATYSWNTGATSKSLTVSPTSNTTYILTASLCGNTLKDTIEVTVKTCNTGDPICSKKVSNNTGCVSTPFIFYLRDKSGGDHYLSGDTTNYQWDEYANGDARMRATGLTASGLSGTFDIDFTFAGNTSTPPTNSPRYSTCFTVGSTAGWEYFTTTSGTILSTNYGNMAVTRKGQATQIGNDANIFQAGYGSSGWVNITGGTGTFSYGDFNVMLSGCVLPGIAAKVCSDDTLSVCIDDLVNLDSTFGEDVVVQSGSSSSAGSSVTVEVGSYTSGVDCCNGNKPNAITYQYVSSNVINNSQTNSSVVTYTAPAGAKVLIIVSTNSNASDTTNPLYRGVVNAGDKFTVDRSKTNKWQANHYLRILTEDGSSLLQFSNIHVSCSQPLISGDQYGTIVIASVTVDGSTCSGGAPDCEASITYVPAPGFTGLDTVTFEVCATGTNGWCADVPVVIEVEDCHMDPECKIIVGNTRGCSSKPYVIYLKDKNGAAHHLSGDSTAYQWKMFTNGDVQFIADGISAPGLSGTFDVDLTFSGATTTPPTNSPKLSSCFTVGSSTGWTYYTTTSGTITSTSYGTMAISRQGPAFQVGDGANITQDGYGGSGWLAVSGGTGHIKSGDINIMLTDSCEDPDPECTRLVSNTNGCSSTPYVIWLKDKNGAAHHLSGDTTEYQWLSFNNGDVRFIANDISASGLSGTFDVDLIFSGRTLTPPTNSPKLSSCFTVGSSTGWVYFTSTEGTITSTSYGDMTITRKGPSFQMGDGANITQDGFGASGWLEIAGGNGHITTGDINVMLTPECTNGDPECDETHTFDPCIITYGKGSYNNSATTISISETISEIKEIVVEGIFKGGKPTAGSFTNGTTTVSWTGSDAKELDNVSGTTDKGYYQATLPAASSVTMNVSNNQTNMHGMAAYVIMKDAFCADNFTSVSDERYYTYHNTHTSTFSMPVTINEKTITAVLPIAEMNNDTRIAVFTLTAGSLSESVTINSYDLGRSMTLQTLTLNDVPGNITSATLTMQSPSSNGDSYITGSAMFNWYLPCETNPGKNRIAGTVFFDADRDTTLDTQESGEPGVMVYLYDDKDNDGVLDANELTPIDSMLSGSDGTYEFFVDYVCTEVYIDSIEYQSGIVNPNNLLGAPGTTFASYDSDSDNLIVELGSTIKDGEEYSIFLKTIETGAYAIISESTDGINFYHNTNIAILTSTKGEYTITADRDVNYIKFDKHAINTVAGYNSYGTASTNVYDYGIYGLQICTGVNSFIIETNLTTYPDGSELTTDNYESAQFDGPNQEDVGNDYGFNGDVFMDGYVFYDADSSGTFDNGENGTPDITVYLYVDLDCDGVLDANETTSVASAETNASGYYSFTRPYLADLSNLPGGWDNCYIIKSDETDYPAGHKLTTDNIEVAKFDGINQEDLNNNFGHVADAAGKNRIAGTVFFDADRDTTLDTQEDGEPGVMVYLYDDKDDDGILDDNERTPIDSMLTGTDGTYEFFVDFVCNAVYIDSIEYQSGIVNPNNVLGAPGTTFASYDTDTDNLIVELGGTIKNGAEYSVFLKTIETGAYAIISESTDGINFYHNTDIAILTATKGEYTITADRDVNFIKFDKHAINTVSGYNSNGSTSTNVADYGIYGVQFCKGINSFIIETNLTTYPDESELTTDNYESAQFDGPNQEDVGNDYGFNGDVFIDGYVFYDADTSGTFDNGESGTPNITVDLFADLDCDGILDANETTSVASAETNTAGYYSFTRPYLADLSNLPDGWDNCYIIKSDVSDYPVGHVLTTDNIEVAEFDSFNQEDLNNNFGHVKKAAVTYCGKLEVTIDHTKVDGSRGHEDFPVYLDLTHSAFKYRKNWPYSWDQGMFSPNGYDVKVCDASGAELPIEIVGYDSTSGNIKIWVQVHKLSATANTILTVKHGIESGFVPDPSTTDVWGADYKAVYHFEDLNDATTNDNDATNFGASSTTGQMGTAVDLDGNDYLRVPYSSSLDVGGNKLTMSAWVNVAASPTTDAPFAVKGPSVNQEAYMFGVDGGTNPVKINSRVTTNTAHYRHDDGALGTNQWVFVQFVYDGALTSGQKRVYVNGSLSHTKAASGNINTGTHDLFIGKRVYTDNRYLTGKIDELRITCAATSADWISTEYNNQFSPTTFATITDSSGCGAVPVTWLDFTAKKVSTNDVELNWSTASEINNSHFEVERSFDGTDFVTLGAPIQGAGNTSQIQTYDAMDYNLPEGVAYYRVKQIDFDGQFDYTPVRVVQILTRNEMVVYPNPANEELNISFKGAKGQEVKVTSLTGQVLDKLVLSKEGFATLNTTNYPHGIYFIEVQGVSGVETQKFTVRK